jgi:hypothetical protein
VLFIKHPFAIDGAIITGWRTCQRPGASAFYRFNHSIGLTACPQICLNQDLRKGKDTVRARERKRFGVAALTSFSGLWIALLLGPARAGAAGPWGSRISGPGDQSPEILRSEVDLVVLPVTVTDRQGRFVSGLKPQDFRAYENGRSQTISLFGHSDVPVTVGLVVDGSGSMLPNRDEVVEAAKDFVNSSNPDDQIFVVNFNERVLLGLPPSVPFTSDVTQLEAAVLRGPSAGLAALSTH